jgi:HAD superfamily hydrolase (TIGR01493 family)
MTRIGNHFADGKKKTGGFLMIKCIAFDCFGTVFDMSSISRDEIKAYVEHVRKDDFTPFKFPDSWWHLRTHADVTDGIRRLQDAGFSCVTLSNGSANLLRYVSRQNGILWDFIIDLVSHRVYKPHVDAYRTVEKQLGFTSTETLMVTANPTFGDIEGAAAIGMQSQVIRQPGMPQTIIELAEKLGVLSPTNARIHRAERKK